MGASAWLVDAVMHVELGAEVHAEGLWAEIFAPHPTALVFRLFYMAVAVAFGVVLWRMNWRERQLRALEQVVISFQRQLDTPALRIMSTVRGLQNRNSVRLDDVALSFAAEIHADASLIDELARGYFEFGRLVQRGETALAIETLRSMESWAAERKVAVKP